VKYRQVVLPLLLSHFQCELSRESSSLKKAFLERESLLSILDGDRDKYCKEHRAVETDILNVQCSDAKRSPHFT